MADETIRLTTQIAAAYLGHHEMAAADLPGLIQIIHSGLVKVALPVRPPQSAVPVKKSVTSDAIMCLECGRPLQMLKRHLLKNHNLTTEEYRAKWSLSPDYPMTFPNYALARSDMAKKLGLGRSLAPKMQSIENMTQVIRAGEREAMHHYPVSRWSKKRG